MSTTEENLGIKNTIQVNLGSNNDNSILSIWISACAPSPLLGMPTPSSPPPPPQIKLDSLGFSYLLPQMKHD